MKPVIAISTDEASYKRGLQSRVNSGYGHAVQKAGGTPILLQIMHNPDAHAENVANAMDGLIVTGGESNIHPLLYGHGISEHTDYMYPPRDHWEHALIKAFIAAGKPVMGICRGLQQINVLLGGTLYFNIHKEIEGSKGHWSGDSPMHVVAHSISLEKDSHFFRATGKQDFLINSYHYQAIKDLASDLKVTATSPDGIIEAIEHKDSNQYLVGYQFHPEMMVDNEMACHLLFEDFIEKAHSASERCTPSTEQNLSSQSAESHTYQ